MAIGLNLFDKNLIIWRNSEFLYIPLLFEPSASLLKRICEQIGDARVSTCTFATRHQKIRSYIEILVDKLPPHILDALPRSADIVGDIAIVEITSELEAYNEVIGKAILSAHKNVKTVLAKTSPVGGVYRLRTFKVMAGLDKTVTLHTENGCKFHVDVARAYFSPRLSYEHRRIASLVEENEIVLDLFAGVGPFAIQIAKSLRIVKIFAVDANPNAVELLRQNVRLNRVVDKVKPLLGDARQIVKKRLVGIADRVIMNLPERAIEFVDVACEALGSSGGIIHFYSFMSSSDTMDMVEKELGKAVKTHGKELLRVQASRQVREVAPYKSQIVLDVQLG